MSCNLGNCCPFRIATRRQRCRFTLFSFMLPCAFYPLCSSSHSRLPRHPTSVSRCEIAICSQNSLIGLRIIDGCGGSAPPPSRLDDSCTDFHTVRRHSSAPSPPTLSLLCFVMDRSFFIWHVSLISICHQGFNPCLCSGVMKHKMKCCFM